MSKLNVAIIGCGGYSGFHAQRLKPRSEVQITALCDVSEDIMRGYIERNLKDYQPPPKMYAERQRMYAQVQPDAVFIVTPHTMHYEHGMEALNAGCHVFMEKPMVTSADQAYQLAEKVRQVGKVFVVGYNSTCTPEFRYLRQLIRDKTLGRLELIMGWLSQDWKRLTTGKWRQDPSLSGGGQAYDSGAHLLNSLCWSVESNVAEVFAFIDSSGTAVDINSAINIKFENGTLAVIAIGGNCPVDGCQLTYCFDNGRVEVDGWGGSWINIHQGRERIKYPLIQGKSQSPDDNFIDAILGRAEPATSPLNGIIQSELMDAVYESARTGKPSRPQRRP